MKRLERLQRERAAKFKKLEELMSTAEADDKRDLSQDETTEFETLKDEITDLDTQIERAVFVRDAKLKEADEQMKAPNVHKNRRPDTMKEKAKEYSLQRAVSRAAKEKDLDGVEAEMNEEAISEFKEARIPDYNPEGINLPSEFIEMDWRNERNKREAARTKKLKEQKRVDMTVGTAADGGYTVNEEFQPYIPVLRPTPALEALGMRVISGVQGNLEFRRGQTTLSGTWLAEGGATPTDNQTFAIETVTPKRLGLTTGVSNQLLFQSAIVSEQFVRQEIEEGITLSIDTAGLHGTGAGNQPMGLDGISNVNEIAIGTDGGALTWAHIVDMVTKVLASNAAISDLGYAITPETMGKLKTTAHAANNGGYLIGQDSMQLNGHNYMWSNQIKKDGTKGSGTALHTAFFGAWAQYILFRWGGVQIIVDPYTKKKESETEITLNTWGNFFARHPQAFTRIKDIDLTA